MKKLILILILLSLIPSISYSQLEYHNWIFGGHYDIDIPKNFTGITFMTETGNPEFLNIQLPKGNTSYLFIWSNEGTADISDSLGNLLFHTADNGIFDAKYKTDIFDENLLSGSRAGTQGVCLAKVGNKFIRIATSTYTFVQNGYELSYVVFSSNEGVFDISPKRIIKDAYWRESLTIIKDTESESFYLLLHDMLAKEYYLYKYEIAIDQFVLKNTIKSKIEHVLEGNLNDDVQCGIKVSPNGKHIVSLTFDGVEILNFDRSTETLKLIKTYEGISAQPYSGEFSPNSEHCYFRGLNGIYAFTNFNDIDNIEFKKVLEYHGTNRGHSGFALGPNGIIYIANHQKHFLSSINNSNDVNNIEYVERAVDLHGSVSHTGLPNVPTTYYFQVESKIDSMELCVGEKLYVETVTQNEPEDIKYTWTAPDGSTYEMKYLTIDSVTKEMSGTFVLTAKSLGYNLKKEVYVKVLGPEFELETYNTSICKGDTNTIYIKNPFAEKVSQSILWSTGDTTREAKINEPGIYSVTVIDFDGCSATKEIVIEDAKPEIEIVNTMPLIFCDGDSTVLEVSPYEEGNEYLWSTGETGKQVIVKTEGTYSVRVLAGENCRDTALVEVKVNDNLQPKITGSNICAGQSATLEALPNDPSYSYEWSNGETTPTIEVSQAGTYTVTVSKAGCTGTAEFTVEESPQPEFTILGESIICNNESVVLSADKDFDEYLWSTNEITKSIEVTEAGTYTLTVTDENSCSATETFTVEKYELSFDISKNSIDFGKVYISENPQDSINIVNTSGFDIVLDMGEKVMLMDGQSYLFRKTFEPKKLGNYFDSHTFHVIEPCDTVITLPITARVYARATISTEDIYTEIGRTETVPVYLECEADLTEQEYTITTDIDRSVFITQDSYVINNNQPINKARTKIHELTGTVLLSDALEYDITFPSYQFTNPYIEVVDEQGKIYIDSICVFDYRNIALTEPTTLITNPNPATEQLNISITTGVQGTLQLELVSTEGRVIYSDSWQQSTRSKQLQINTKEIPSGLYQLRLITPYDAITTSVVVVE